MHALGSYMTCSKQNKNKKIVIYEFKIKLVTKPHVYIKESKKSLPAK
jgi:hypothetical protein